MGNDRSITAGGNIGMAVTGDGVSFVGGPIPPGDYTVLPRRVRPNPADPTPGYQQRYITGLGEGGENPIRAFDMFRQVFESQAYFQGLLGHDYSQMDVPELIEYLKGQIMALQAETIEALDEMSWKPWTHGEKTVNREAMLGECADILCFLVNIVLGLGFTSEDFYRYHQEKALRNIKRQEDKYDGVQGKCPGCKRDISDLRAKGLPTGTFGGVDYCSPECIQKTRNVRVDSQDVVTEHGDRRFIVTMTGNREDIAGTEKGI